MAESWSSSSSSTTVEELAREIRLEVDEYKRRGYLTLSAHLDEYRNRREREAKMIIERERLTAELLMFSGDTLTRQFTENMTGLSTTSSLGHFLTVDVPSAARRLMMEGDGTWQGNLKGRLPFDEVVAIKDRIHAFADSISNTV
ncbi:hypothetical protein FOZ63_009957, partial [Perkinsus olseni]